jgi:hypothetical protein
MGHYVAKSDAQLRAGRQVVADFIEHEGDRFMRNVHPAPHSSEWELRSADEGRRRDARAMELAM